ncbi:MAG: aminotransferase class IV [Anaerolineales bacterium]|jgi:branched-chain amino acid aminotransferase|nr:aminotransferase class IV [Anaerolineales bacterium]
MKTYQLTPAGAREIPLSAANFDEASRQLPDGLYTTFRTRAGGRQALGLQSHLDRLYLPAAAQAIRPQVSEAELRQFLSQICAAQAGESRLRLTLGVSDSPGAVFVSIQPFLPPGLEVYQQGVRVVSVEVARSSPRLKSTAFIQQSAELRKLVTGDVYEVLLCRNGSVLEGMTSNFYVIEAGGLVTSRNGILLGVTRRTLIRLARRAGLEVEYRAPALAETFQEAFLTSSSRGVVPIVAIDGRPVGQGRPGPWTKKLIGAYEEYVQNHSQKI